MIAKVRRRFTFRVLSPLLWGGGAAILVYAALIGSSAAGFAHSVDSGSKVTVVAAENEYGSMAQAIGGNRVTVKSLLTNPNTDPHAFEASASTALTLAAAELVIKNGVGYDSWVDKLLGASPRSGRMVFSVGEYLGHRTGDNPHVWYFPPGWTREAAVIAADLSRLDPSHKSYFQRRLAAWLRSLQPVYKEISAIRPLTRGKKVIATEPVYGYMIAALGATSLDYDFQKAIMDGTDPSPRAVIDFESALQSHTAHMLFYNSQVTGTTTGNMRSLASNSHVPIVGVTETQPQKLSFVQWQLTQLQDIKRHWK